MVSVTSAHYYAIPLLLIAALLTGCVSGDDPPETEGPDEQGSEAGLGTITGKVLTVNLDAVANGRVQLVENGEGVAETTTDDEGRYTITNIEPGDYRIQASGTCCKEEVRAVSVVADEDVNLDLQLEVYSSDDLQEPREERYEWTGFLACNVRAALGANVCGIVELVADNATDDDFLREWTIGPGLETVVGGMTWDSPGASLGDELVLLMEVAGRSNSAPQYTRQDGPSPVEFRVDSGHVEDNYDEEDDEGHNLHQYDFKNVEEELELQYRVFAGGDVNVVYQQQFTIHWKLYYWEAAPEDASALPDQ